LSAQVAATLKASSIRAQIGHKNVSAITITNTELKVKLQ
jgi:hypothetical protein